MKKLLKIIPFILVFCCVAALFAACGEDSDKDKVPIPLDTAIEKEIISNFAAAHSADKYPLTEDEISLRCYGAFDGVYVLFIDVEGWAYTDAIETDVVAGVKFVYGSGHKMTAYSDGAFYSLSDAYKADILSRDNLKKVQKNYKSDHSYLY